MKKIRSIKERFEEKYIPEPNTGCWLWTAAQDSDGYGRMITGSRTDQTRVSRTAHTLSFELYRHEIPSGLQILHKCDVRSCVNPDHMELGTWTENMKDKIKKGRQAMGGKTGSAKLTEEQVLEIKSLRKHGWGLKKIADRFEITLGHVFLISKNRTWKHLNRRSA